MPEGVCLLARGLSFSSSGALRSCVCLLECPGDRKEMSSARKPKKGGIAASSIAPTKRGIRLAVCPFAAPGERGWPKGGVSGDDVLASCDLAFAAKICAATGPLPRPPSPPPSRQVVGSLAHFLDRRRKLTLFASLARLIASSPARSVGLGPRWRLRAPSLFAMGKPVFPQSHRHTSISP